MAGPQLSQAAVRRTEEVPAIARREWRRAARVSVAVPRGTRRSRAARAEDPSRVDPPSRSRRVQPLPAHAPSPTPRASAATAHPRSSRRARSRRHMPPGQATRPFHPRSLRSS